MAGYLNRLAGRALGATPLAEPAVPARFSPVEQGEAGWSGAASQATAQETAFRASPLSSKRQPQGESAAALPIRASSEPKLVQNFRPDQSEQEGNASPNLGQTAFAPARDNELEDFASMSAPLHRPQADPERSAQVSRFDLVDRATSPASENSLSGQQDESRSPSRGDRARTPVTREARPVMRDAASATREQRTPSHSPVAAPPSVRVTIGRVDIRADIAAPLPAPAPAARTRSSSVSLDQFLKERSAARR